MPRLATRTSRNTFLALARLMAVIDAIDPEDDSDDTLLLDDPSDADIRSVGIDPSDLDN